MKITGKILAPILVSVLVLTLFTASVGAWDTPPGNPGNLVVHKFHDRNQNGVQDVGEEDLAGWPFAVYLVDEDPATGAVILTLVGEGTTGADGTVTFTGLDAPRPYKVMEPKLDCWEVVPAPGQAIGYDEGRNAYFQRVWLDSDAITRVEFGNVYTCPALAGCTPGYWRNHLEDWPATGYAPADIFNTVFGVGYFASDYTLGEAINQGGGGLNVLARHGTAALLSAAHPEVNYPFTVAEVIAKVQAGEVADLEWANELGCTIP